MFDRLDYSRPFVRREAIVQGECVALVLDQHTATELGDHRELALDQLRQRRRGGAVAGIDIGPEFGTVTADRRQEQRRKNEIDVGDRAAADEGHRAVERRVERFQRRKQVGIDPDFARSWREIEQRAVDVEQERGGFSGKRKEFVSADLHRPYAP